MLIESVAERSFTVIPEAAVALICCSDLWFVSGLKNAHTGFLHISFLILNKHTLPNYKRHMYFRKKSEACFSMCVLSPFRSDVVNNTSPLAYFTLPPEWIRVIHKMTATQGSVTKHTHQRVRFLEELPSRLAKGKLEGKGHLKVTLQAFWSNGSPPPFGNT